MWEIWFTALEDLSLANGHALDKALSCIQTAKPSVFDAFVRQNIMERRAGLYKLVHPAILNGKTWSKLGEI